MGQEALVKKVSTFKSGNFVFSRKFSLRKLQPLRIESRILYDTVRDLPILPDLATHLQEELIRRSIFGTAAIEGNPLNEERVGQIISETTEKTFHNNAEQEIANLQKVYAMLYVHAKSNEKLYIDEEIIKKVHEMITGNIKYEYNNPGNYRNHLVRVGDKEHGGIYTPPRCLEDIKNLMKEFIEWINSDEVVNLDPPIRAGLIHYYLGLIHPFGDGNGRTARWVEAYLLQSSGIKYVPIMLSNYYYQNKDDYLWAFSNTIKGKDNDVTPFLTFVLQGFKESLNEIKARIIFFIRKFTLRDFYMHLRNNRKITQRQYDLLITLLDYGRPFSLKELFSKNPFNIMYRNVSSRTAMRDLKKLVLLNGVNLIKQGKDKKYQLNWRALG
jgi:Fic family protein